MEVKPKLTYVIVLAILAALVIQTVIGINHNSATYDELDHITSGYSKLLTGDFRAYTETPPFVDMLYGAPLLFLDLRFPFYHPSWKIKNQNVLSEQFFFVYNDKLEQMLSLSRMVALVLSLITAAIIFIFAKEVFGTKAALFTIFLYSFEPTIIAHSGLAMVDLPLMLFSTLTLFFLWKFYKNPNAANLLLMGMFLGLAQVTKFSAVFLFPIILIFFIILIFSNSYGLKIKERFLSGIKNDYLKKTCYFGLCFIAMAAISYLIICSTYLFGGIGKPISKSIAEDVHLDKAAYADVLSRLDRQPLKAISELPNPLPYYYVKGLAFNIFAEDDAAESKPFGKLYALASFMLKVPLPLVILFIIFIFSYYRSFFSRDGLFFMIPILLFFIWFGMSSRAGGLRYLLPAIALIFILSGKALAGIFSGRRTFKIVSAILIAWYAFASFSIVPNHMDYFNEIIGPEDAHKYFSDANINLGQNWKELIIYLEVNGITEIKTNSLIWTERAYLERYGIRYSSLGCEEIPREVVALKLTNTDECRFRIIDKQPTKKIGYTINVYG